mmetsp:Transcript_15416/g.22665  ORF Transcript_15416/g.22665 Transcript_15416/m.22665 type:complete len:269 (+) Transcript_15416:260-1066(+)
MRQFSRHNFTTNGFYVGTFKEKHQKDAIDKLLVMLKKKSRLLDFPRAETIFNTMMTNNVKRTQIKKVVNKNITRVDAGRNQLTVQKCTDRELKKQCEIVGNIFRDQVFQDLNINEINKSNIVLSILETEASDGNNHVPSQLMHSDVDPNDPTLRETHMFIGIIGLESESYIRLLRYSHNRSKKSKRTKSIYALKYIKYQYFVGHPQLAHGGYGSLFERGLRLHGYHGFPAKVQEQTYPAVLDLFDQDRHLKKQRGKIGRLDTGIPAGS